MCCVSCIVYKYNIYIHCIVHIDNTVYLDIYKMCVQNKCALCTQETCVNVVNNDNERMPTVVIFKHYILNILSSDYCNALKLCRKFEKSCKMFW